MPCSDGGPSYQDDPETKRRLDLATRLLCSLCRRITKTGRDTLIYEDEELANWWGRHQEADRKREEKERKREAEERFAEVLAEEVRQAKKAALSKLTPQDRKLLGLRLDKR